MSMTLKKSRRSSVWLGADDIFELGPDLGTYGRKNNRSPEHAFQVSFHRLEIVLRRPIAIERRMLNHTNHALRANPDWSCRHTPEDEWVLRKNKVALRPASPVNNAMFKFSMVSAVRCRSAELGRGGLPPNGINALVRPKRIAASNSNLTAEAVPPKNLGSAA